MNWLSGLSVIPYFTQTTDSYDDSSTKCCKLGELLQIKDSKWSQEALLDTWKALDFQTITEKKVPQQYCDDVKRCSIVVGTEHFIHPYSEHESEARFQRINNRILSIINSINNCPLANTTRGVHIIRYLAQDLISQGIFVIDPTFPAVTVEAYDKKKMLLLPLQEGAGKEPDFSIYTQQSTLCIQATQYWKVVNKFKPTELLGYDGLKIHISISLSGATERTILEHFQQGSCNLLFHGFRKTLDEIKF